MTVEDVHGCSLTSGHTWCEAQRRCISEFEICDAGTWDAGACVYEWAGLSWDLTPLQRAEHYVVEDVQAQSDTKYVIGMCRGIDPLEIAPACNVTTGSALEKLTGFSPAYQVMDGGTQCYRCGGEYVGPEGAAQHVSAGLLNLQAPAAGIFLKYDGGNTCETGSPTTRDACDAEVNGRNYCRRSMQINLICNDHISSVPFLEQITEESGCAYSVTLNSEYGCPRECPRAEGMVCHNRGICGYDGLEAGRTVGGGNGVARCLCAAPWGGPSCSEPLAERVVVVAVAAAHGALYYVGLSTLGFGLALVLCSRKLRYLVELPSMRSFAAARKASRNLKTRQFQSYQSNDVAARSPFLDADFEDETDYCDRGHISESL
ncbi:hypothetical protein M885DRAFT_573914 [Pelagophyceae sp. CCMP2097]|nr:hypothetical protein M885DRAFT_573914 [Pelagophyceae sp. CCMP2097]